MDFKDIDQIGDFLVLVWRPSHKNSNKYFDRWCIG